MKVELVHLEHTNQAITPEFVDELGRLYDENPSDFSYVKTLQFFKYRLNLRMLKQRLNNRFVQTKEAELKRIQFDE